MLTRRHGVLLGLAAGACATAPNGRPAPKPLYRDPVHDGAADPSLVRDPATGDWLMFYTNRRADLVLAAENDVSWVHGTAIAIARSRDRGRTWTYQGAAQLPVSEPTLWAPNIESIDGVFHMFLTVVPGVFSDWNAPRRIVHLTGADLAIWRLVGDVDLRSQRVIDATVVRLPAGPWRMWYKDETDDSRIHFADTTDLVTWIPRGRALADAPAGEGPKAFHWRGAYWLIVDHWRGLGVYRNKDAQAYEWRAQAGRLLATPGAARTDRAKGQHADVIVNGDRAFLFYFTHQENEPENARDPHWRRRSAIQVAELHESNGVLSVDRDAAVYVDLG